MSGSEGTQIVSGTAVNIVISVLVFVLIAGVFAAFLFLAVNENEIAKIKGQMDKVEEVSVRVNQNGETLHVDDFSPPKDVWYLRSFSNFIFPEGACLESSAKSCICICDDYNCEGKFDCRDFDFDIIVDHTTTGEYVAVSGGPGGGGVSVPSRNTEIESLKLVDSLYDLVISKESNLVKIGSGQ